MTCLVKNNRFFFIIPFLLINLIYSQNNSNQIFGFITDSKSGEALIGANVFIQENGKGMATDINGYYVISGIEMAESYIKDLKKTLPCAAYLNGEYGVKGLYAGVPVVIGKNGVEKVVEIPLDNMEKEKLDISIEEVKKLFDVAKKIDQDLKK